VIPGNDDAMRAIQLYAAGIADAVIEGKSQVPQVVVGEDEFVELDEQGNPKKKGARGRAPKPAAAVRAKRAPSTARRRPVLPSIAADVADDVGEEVAAEAAGGASASAPRANRGRAGDAARRGGAGGGRGRG
jgi:small subunit ribosomal protein S2